MSCPLPLRLPTDPTPLLSNGVLHVSAHLLGWLLALAFACNAICASVWLVYKHLSHFHVPNQQKQIVRILFMVPIYSVASFLSYFFVAQALYFQLVRDCYESIVIAAFFQLLLAYLAEEKEERNPTEAERHVVLRRRFRNVRVKKWIFPLGFVRWRPDGGGTGEGASFLWLMRLGVIQYVVIRPLSTLVSVVTQAINLYCVSSWSPTFLHLYCSVFVSVSVSIAMYAVLQLWTTLSAELVPFDPLLKFLSVKTVIFLTFWQDSGLGLLHTFGVIKDQQYWSAADIVVGISAILECSEMMVFGFLHIKAFSYGPYRSSPSSRPPMSRFAALGTALDFRDLSREMWEGVGWIFSSKAVNRREFGFRRAEDLVNLGMGERKRPDVRPNGEMDERGHKRESQQALLDQGSDYGVVQLDAEEQEDPPPLLETGDPDEADHRRFESTTSSEVPMPKSFDSRIALPPPHRSSNPIDPSPYVSSPPLPLQQEQGARPPSFASINFGTRTPSIFLPQAHRGNHSVASADPSRVNEGPVRSEGRGSSRFVFENY